MSSNRAGIGGEVGAWRYHSSGRANVAAIAAAGKSCAAGESKAHHTIRS